MRSSYVKTQIECTTKTAIGNFVLASQSTSSFKKSIVVIRWSKIY